MAKHKDIRPLLNLNTDDAPELMPPGDVSDALNIRMGNSNEQHGRGNAETLQGEIEVLLGVSAPITYYGSPIGGEFIYEGFDEVQIGNQVWMKRNYDAEYPGSKAYNDVEANVATYGRLYTHEQIMKSDFCPSGWRVPTEADVDELLAFLGGEMVAGGKLKEFDTSHWLSPNTGASDEFGFRALPGGKYDDAFSLLQSFGFLWLADEGEPTAPVALNGSEIAGTTFMANWLTKEGATGYKLDVSENSDFSSFVAGYEDLDVGNVLTYEVSGLSGSTLYYFRVRAYNEIGDSPNSNTSTALTLFIANDWFLPSRDLLKQMYLNLYLFGVGNFAYGKPYWSSSETDATQANLTSFASGGQGGTLKSLDSSLGNDFHVRAARSFTAGIGEYSLRDTGPAGGLICYIDGTTYYEAAPTDQSVKHSWSNVVALLIGTTGTAIGTGAANTAAIIAQVGHTDSAAKLCDDLVIEV